MTAPADGWKMTDSEIADMPVWGDRDLADAAGRKALLWAADHCEHLDLVSYLEKRLWPSDCAAAIREAAK